MQGWVKRVMFSGLLAMAVGGCSTISVSEGVKVATRATNYTDNYVNFTIYSVSGENLGVGGRASSFAKGGTGGEICCGVIPKPGGIVRVDWKVGDDTASYSKEVMVFGNAGVPADKNDFSYLIVRFFPQKEIEVEIIPGEDFEPKNLRVDKLYSGKKIMRHKGE